MQFKLTLVFIVGLIAISAALPARKNFAYQRLARYSSGKLARSTQAAAAVTFLEAGDSEPVAVEVEPSTDEVVSEVGVQEAEESYPGEDATPVDTEVAVSSDSDGQVVESEVQTPVESDAVPVEEPVDENVAVPVEEAVQPEEAVEGTVDTSVVPSVAPQGRRVAAVQADNENESKSAPPAGTYFPISFGESGGSAVAIANSFSNAKGGSATSHAVAYGSQAQPARTRIRQSN